MAFAQNVHGSVDPQVLSASRFLKGFFLCFFFTHTFSAALIGSSLRIFVVIMCQVQLFVRCCSFLFVPQRRMDTSLLLSHLQLFFHCVYNWQRVVFICSFSMSSVFTFLFHGFKRQSFADYSFFFMPDVRLLFHACLCFPAVWAAWPWHVMPCMTIPVFPDVMNAVRTPDSNALCSRESSPCQRDFIGPFSSWYNGIASFDRTGNCFSSCG